MDIGDFLGGSLGSLFDDFNDYNSQVGRALGFSSKSDVSAQMEYQRRMAQPTKYGWSWNDYNQALEMRQWRKQLNESLSASSAANLAYNQSLNQILPSAMREGLELAGYNPMLAILGNYSAQTGSVSPSFGGSSRSAPSVSGRSGNAGVGQSIINRVMSAFTGEIGAKVSNLRQDTLNKQASNADIQASANLKNAEAANTIARTETENAIRNSAVREKRLAADYGSGEVGSLGRIYDRAVKDLREKITDSLTGLSDSSVNSADARLGERISTPDKPSSAKQHAYDDEIRRRRAIGAKRRGLRPERPAPKWYEKGWEDYYFNKDGTRKEKAGWN